MIFVNYQGGDYYFFEHSVWNGESLFRVDKFSALYICLQRKLARFHCCMRIHISVPVHYCTVPPCKERFGSN